MRLIICEKDNAAKRISDILSNGHFKTEKRGRVPVYLFVWENERTVTLGLRGHIINMDFPKSYNNWSAVDPIELIDVKPERMVSAKGIASVLSSLAKEADRVYVATDYDREGELIGKEAVEYAFGSGQLEKAMRAHFSSLTPDEIRRSFSSLGRMDLHLASAAETRQIVDLVWGAALTRFISLASGRLGHDFLSVGRVQSPTLDLIVNREKEISAFVPEPYFRIEALLGRDGLDFEAAHVEGDIFDQGKAKEIFSKVKDAKEGVIIDVKERERTDRPPVPFNTTQFIRAANNLSLSAARIMSIAEDLYTNGYISYPRTDNTVYPRDLDLRKTVDSLAKGPYMEAASHILSKEKITATRGSKQTTDHPPIYPTAFATKAELGRERFKIYDLVVRRFLATLHDPCRVKVTSVRTDINGETFTSSGIRIISPGWRSVYTMSVVKEKELPPLEKGVRVKVEEISLLDKETKPPRRFSQGGLIQEMERLGLGTKSTRHEIIQKLYSRRYIEESPPRPTLSGSALIDALEKHARMITEPDMTSRLERDMERIANRELTQDAVVMESREMLRKVLRTMEKEKAAIGRDIASALKEQDVVGKCPRCSNDLLLVRSKWGKRYVRCSRFPGCSKSYPLPQKGKITFSGNICEVCRSPMMTLYSRGKRPREVCINPACPGKRAGTGGSEGEKGKNIKGSS